MTPEQKKIKQEEYKKRVIESIARYTEQNINIELPMCFVDSNYYNNEQNTISEFERFNAFVTSKNAMKTTQVDPIPNPQSPIPKLSIFNLNNLFYNFLYFIFKLNIK